MDHGAPRHYTSPRVFFFFLSSSPPLPFPRRSSLLHGAKRARKILREKNATASVPIPASTAQCTRQKHPLNIGVYGPRRGKSARVKPPWSFGHLSAFAVPFLSILLSISLFSLYRSFALSLFRSAASARTHPLLNRLPAFPASSPPTVSLIPFSSSSRRFSGFLAPAHAGVRSALAGSNPAIKGTAGKSVVRRPRKTAQ